MSNRTSSSKKKNQKGNSSVAQVRQAPLAKSYRIQTQPPRRSQNNGVTVIKGSLEFASDEPGSSCFHWSLHWSKFCFYVSSADTFTFSFWFSHDLIEIMRKPTFECHYVWCGWNVDCARRLLSPFYKGSVINLFADSRDESWYNSSYGLRYTYWQ